MCQTSFLGLNLIFFYGNADKDEGEREEVKRLFSIVFEALRHTKKKERRAIEAHFPSFSLLIHLKCEWVKGSLNPIYRSNPCEYWRIRS